MALIVDMRMPSCCGSCRASGTDVCKSWFGFLKHLREGRPIGCPIKNEIPDEHGRLVDADALIEQVLNGEHPRYDSMVRMIQSAPTIVEAST